MHAGFQLMFSTFLRAFLPSHSLALPRFHASSTFQNLELLSLRKADRGFLEQSL
jgi:hypothetical protein